MVRPLRRRREVDKCRPARRSCADCGRSSSNSSSEIPCRVRNSLPLEGVISLAKPANNGEPPTPHLERAIPWEVENEASFFDPVTTEAKAEMTFLPTGKSKNVIRRRPSEALIHLPSYVSGYVDGEGCFCVSLRPQRRITVGWEVRPSFSVSQNGDRAELLSSLPNFFGCGTIRPDRSDRTLKFEVRSLKNLLLVVVPFFERYPLQSSKQGDFELFSRICRLMAEGFHLCEEGLIEIADLATRMNSGGARRFTSAMVRESFRGEGIVCAPRNRGTT
jgi:LAGLIDADG endonuclease